MKRLPIQNRLLGKLKYLMLGTLLVAVQNSYGQETFQNLYSPAMVKKHKLTGLTIKYSAAANSEDQANAGNANSTQVGTVEEFRFDSLGRPHSYQMTDQNTKLIRSPGPHILSFFEYSSIGNSCHRHDSTVFGNTSVWYYTFNTKNEPISVERYANENEALSYRRDYVYDLQGRMEKERAIRYRQNEGLRDDCYWKFYVNDNFSFRATSLSPEELSSCSCNLEYLDDKGRTVREVRFDSLGNIAQSTIISYDRTGKPVKLTNLAADSKTTLKAAEIAYERDGVVQISLFGPDIFENVDLAKFGMKARDFVIGNWTGIRLLRELNLKYADKVYARYTFDYQTEK